MAKFGFTYMFTQDLAVSKAFYADALGLDLIWDEADVIAFNIDGHQPAMGWLLDFPSLRPYESDPMNQTIEITCYDEAG